MKASQVGKVVVLAGRTVISRKAVLRPGQVECPVCRAAVTPIDGTRLRRHRDLFKHACQNLLVDYAQVSPEVIAAALAESERAALAYAEEAAKPKAERKRKAYERKATGRCRECDRQITGERWYCGPCVATRDSYKGRKA